MTNFLEESKIYLENAMKLNKVFIWGHELHNHTHSYIHNAFYRTFKHLGYNVYWFNEDGLNNYPDDKNIDYNNALYIVHGGLESKYLPINDSSYYIWHSFSCPIYKEFDGEEYLIPKNSLLNTNNKINKKNLIKLHTFWKPCDNINCPDYENGCNEWSKKTWKNKVINKYYWYNLENNIIYMPWATDLLPHEIDENIKTVELFDVKKISNFIGMPLEHWDIFAKECKNNGIEYKNYGGTFNKDSDRNKSIEENMKLIQESIIAPALQDEHQIKHEYIPCRIFKNISYGKMGLTNNKIVNELFDNKLIYSKNINELVKKGLEFEEKEDKFEIIKDLMINVKENHTYINRIHFILDFLREFKNIEIS